MSRADFVVTPELSARLAPGHLGSADTLIKSRKQVEVKPQSDETIELTGSPTSRTEFVLNAHSGWMDNAKSHLEFEVACDAYDVTNTYEYVKRALCTGGAHALIRNVMIVDGSGTEISNTPEYAKLYGLISNYTQSPEHVEKSGMFSGDSVNAYGVEPSSYAVSDVRQNVQAITSNVNLATYDAKDAGNGYAEIASIVVEENIAVGDIIELRTDVGSFTSAITAIDVDRTYLRFAVDGLGSADAAAGTISSITKLVASFEEYSTRRYVATRNTARITTAATAASAWVKLQIRIANPFLQLEEYIPLLFIPNLRIIIEWNPAWLCMMVGMSSVASTKNIAVRIRNPRYIMSIVEPVEQVIADWHARYSSDQGLIYHFVDYYNTRKYFATLSNISFVVPCTYVSARAAIAAMYPVAAFVQADSAAQVTASGVADSWSLDKTGTFYAAKVHEYEFVVGSDRFPLDGRVRLDKLGGENLLHNLKTLGVADSKDLKIRFKPCELRGMHPTALDISYGLTANGTTYNDSEESLKTIFTADLTKEGELSGVSLRNQDLQPMFYHASSGGAWTNEDAYDAPLYCLVWVPHDRVVRISKADGGVRVFD